MKRKRKRECGVLRLLLHCSLVMPCPPYIFFPSKKRICAQAAISNRYPTVTEAMAEVATRAKANLCFCESFFLFRNGALSWSFPQKNYIMKFCCLHFIYVCFTAFFFSCYLTVFNSAFCIRSATVFLFSFLTCQKNVIDATRHFKISGFRTFSVLPPLFVSVVCATIE
ncbi:hypothetical protein ABB37_07642 [Leptomonas pyrrhocoris]|uniref:Secreted protein n=1 Tax=Leptomonas pyrrhocoris TaxID=157538 RepID=A0A0N0DT13_LEPPY|nr:hypothetical protein ABB37_07642 [Leptomonas pyrrhocoris]KPA76842.1 hypothetical protein ABB37_07642 [Leptomonas pyrrhocoris]|eukprot:XP_015655281.1 hypothetical protein ABB37_07642 [Leptomonas pyrrhocoris]